MYFSVYTSYKKKMKTIETMLNEELRRIQSIIKETNKRLEKVPKGKLRISGKKSNREYYYIDAEKKQNGRYLKIKERVLAEQIAQRDYDNSLVKSLNIRRKAIEQFLKRYGKNGINEL